MFRRLCCCLVFAVGFCVFATPAVSQASVKQELMQLQTQVRNLAQQNQALFKALIQENKNSVNSRYLPSLSHMLRSYSASLESCHLGNCSYPSLSGKTSSLHWRQYLQSNDFSLFASICLAVLVLVILILMFAIKRSYERLDGVEKVVQASAKNPESTHNMAEVSGEDVHASQLDLANALIEMGENESALEALQEVMQSGSAEQQQEAKKLIASIEAN